MGGIIAPSPMIGRVERVGISESDMEVLSTTVLVARLVAGGVSRLTAARFVEIQRGSAAAGKRDGLDRITSRVADRVLGCAPKYLILGYRVCRDGIRPRP